MKSAVIEHLKHLAQPRIRPFRRKPGSAPDSRSIVIKWLIVAAEIVLIVLLFPAPELGKTHRLREGMVSSERIVAPSDFYVWKDPDAYGAERARARSAVPPVLVQSASIAVEQLAALDSLWARVSGLLLSNLADSAKIAGLSNLGPVFNSDTMLFLLDASEDEKKRRDRPTPSSLYKACKSLLSEVYAAGFVEDMPSLASGSSGSLVVRREGLEKLLPASEVRDRAGTREHIKSSLRERFGEDERQAGVCYRILSSFVRPNLLPDRESTEERRRKAEEQVTPYKGYFAKDEKIIDANERVTPFHVETLNSMERERARRSLELPFKRVSLFGGRLLITTALILLFVAYLRVLRPEYDRTKHLLLFGLLIVIPAAGASVIVSHPGWSPFLVPLALTAMLATLLMDSEVGLVLTFTGALIVGLILNGNFQATVVLALCGALAAYLVRHVRHRQQFYTAMIFLPCTYVLLIAATDVFRFVSFRGLLSDLLPGVVAGFLSPILAMGLLPIFESTFRITTDITLLELSDLNRPLLREAAVRAPGTFAHSITMANLSETAAEAVGANPLVARVGCYYHDIGKMMHPQYFIENQVGMKNPHDKLAPSMSATIIMSHVRQGQSIAGQHRLPRVVSDIILQHQGTSLVEYFFERAASKEGPGGVREEVFRYPGPKPQTKEAGIIMLADGVEAASRTVKEPTPARLKGLINGIIKKRFTEGELDECDLTMKDLHRIAESFLHVLLGTLHTRVEYPSSKEVEGGPDEVTVADYHA